MSGRVGHLAAGFGNLLSVKPILTMRDGKLDLLEKVRTRSKVLARVVELVSEAMAGQPITQMAVLNAAARDEAIAFEAQLRAALPCPETIIHADVTAGLSVHTGAGMLGVVAGDAEREQGSRGAGERGEGCRGAGEQSLPSSFPPPPFPLRSSLLLSSAQLTA